MGAGVAEDDLGGRAAPAGPAGPGHLDRAGPAQQACDQIEIGMHHVQRQRVQAQVVALPQQRSAVLDLQRPQRPVPLPGHRLAQVLIGRAEPGEHVHERPATGRQLDRHDAARNLECPGQRQLDEHVPAGLHGAHGNLGVQPGGQADVDQVHRRVGDERVKVGRGGEPELAVDPGQLARGPAEHDHLMHIGSPGVHGGMDLAKSRAQQRDLYRGQLLSRQPAPAGTRRAAKPHSGTPGHHVKRPLRHCAQ